MSKRFRVTVKMIKSEVGAVNHDFHDLSSALESLSSVSWGHDEGVVLLQGSGVKTQLRAWCYL